MTWPKTKLKFVARFGYGDALPTDETQDGPYDVFGSNGPFALFSRANTRAPAIVVGRKGSYGKVNWTPEPCYASDTTFFVDESTTKNHLRWIFWLLQTLRLDEGTDEAAVPGLNRESAYSRDVFVPPLRQQRAIADYLDRETARLDALVAAKERVLELLMEKRRALITSAVTRGLDPHSPQRESGVPWLGWVPAHWETWRSKRLFSLRNERAPLGVRQLTASQDYGVIPQSEFVEREGRRVVEVEKGADILKQVEENDFVISMRSFQGGIELSRYAGSISSAYVVLIPTSKVNVPFFARLFKSTMYIQALRSTSSLVRDGQALRYENFTLVDLPLPPYDEQQHIANYLDARIQRLDRLVAAIERTVTLIKERRAVLIASAIAGEMEVAA